MTLLVTGEYHEIEEQVSVPENPPTGRVRLYCYNGAFEAKDEAGADYPLVSGINKIGNVNAPAPSDGQALVWDNTAGEWIPGSSGDPNFVGEDSAPTVTASGTDSIAAGPLADAAGFSAIAFGYFAVVNSLASGGIAIGVNSAVNNPGDGGIALGKDTGVYGDEAIAIGQYSKANQAAGNGGIAIGNYSYARQDESIALGVMCYAEGIESIAIGNEAKALETNDIAIGWKVNNSTGTVGGDTIGIGTSADLYGAFGIAIGWVARGEANSVAIGKSVNAGASDAIALGRYAQATGADSIAMGRSAKAAGTNSISIGFNSAANNPKSTVIGIGASGSSYGDNVVAVGYQAYGYGNASIAIGVNSRANFNSGYAGIALGYGAGGWYDNSVAIGVNTATLSKGEMAFGSGLFGTDYHSAAESTHVCRAETTDATATLLSPLQDNANHISVQAESAMNFTIDVVGYETATGDTFAERIHGAIKNVAGTTSLVGTVTQEWRNEDAGAAAWAVAITADNTNDMLQIQVTGEAAHTIRWVARVKAAVVAF